MNLKSKLIIAVCALCAVAGVTGAAVVIRGFHRAGVQSRMKSCQESLTKIDGSKEQWALENRKTLGDIPTREDLLPPTANACPGYRWPNCPSGGSYVINPIGTVPICTSGLPGHSLSQMGMTPSEVFKK